MNLLQMSTKSFTANSSVSHTVCGQHTCTHTNTHTHDDIQCCHQTICLCYRCCREELVSLRDVGQQEGECVSVCVWLHCKSTSFWTSNIGGYWSWWAGHVVFTWAGPCRGTGECERSLPVRSARRPAQLLDPFSGVFPVSPAETETSGGAACVLSCGVTSNRPVCAGGEENHVVLLLGCYLR